MSAPLGFLMPGQTGTPGKSGMHPDSASKRQQWTTNDENSADFEEYVEYSSAHWMVQLRINILL